MARTRNKVSLALISDDSARRSTFNSRKKGLLKKVRELATLCGVMACAIIYGPTDPNPETWPSPADTALALAQYNNAPETKKKHRKMMMINPQEFLQQGIRKLQEQLQRQQYKTRQIEMDCLLYDGLVQQGNGLSIIADKKMATSLAWMVDAKMNKLQQRIEAVRASRMAVVNGMHPVIDFQTLNPKP